MSGETCWPDSFVREGETERLREMVAALCDVVNDKKLPHHISVTAVAVMAAKMMVVTGDKRAACMKHFLEAFGAYLAVEDMAAGRVGCNFIVAQRHAESVEEAEEIAEECAADLEAARKAKWKH